MAKKARRKATPGTMEDARRLLWRALERAQDLLDAQKTDPETGESVPDDALALKAIHAISQGAAAYSKIVEVGELEARITEMSDRLDAMGAPGPRLGRVGT